MAGFSAYEQWSWEKIQERKAHLEQRKFRQLVPAGVRDGIGQVLGKAQSKFPGVAKNADKVALGFAKAASGVGRFVGKNSRLTLSDSRVLAAFKKAGHPVQELAEIADLDMEIIERKVMPRYLSHLYAAGAGVEGGLMGFLIAGGEITGIAGDGAGAAPGAGIVVGALTTDVVSTVALASRVIGHVGMYYGYDSKDPGEELFHLAVLNLGAAVSQTAQYASYMEISQLTQLLARNAPYAKLNEHLVPVIARQFTDAFGLQLTKAKLGELVPVLGIAVGFGTNYLLIDRVADAAYWAYRERFLQDKRGGGPIFMPSQPTDLPDPEDMHVDLLDLLEQAGAAGLPETAAGDTPGSGEEQDSGPGADHDASANPEPPEMDAEQP